MPRTLTATDRKALIRLASELEKGDEQRRAILAGLSDGELFDKREVKTATMYSPDESFYDSVLDAANEAHWKAQSIDGPKGRAAKKLYTDMLKALVKKEKADGVDPRKMKDIINETWRDVHR